jgi:hypothetical protein
MLSLFFYTAPFYLPIARFAIENNLILLHDDRDFDTLTDMFQATHCKKCGLCHIYHLKNLVNLWLREKNKHRNIAVRGLIEPFIPCP